MRQGSSQEILRAIPVFSPENRKPPSDIPSESVMANRANSHLLKIIQKLFFWISDVEFKTAVTVIDSYVHGNTLLLSNHHLPPSHHIAQGKLRRHCNTYLVPKQSPLEYPYISPRFIALAHMLLIVYRPTSNGLQSSWHENSRPIRQKCPALSRG